MRLKFLQIIFSLAIGLMAGSAQSIGLGKLSTNSELGEPLHLTIPLLSVSTAQLEDLKVGLASAGVYAALGWPYPQTAGQMKFEVESYTEGEATIFITTDTKISQTILPLVVQVSWPGGGQLQRDFMVLLDPPEYVIALTEANIPSSSSGGAETTAEITTTALEIPVTTTVTAISEPTATTTTTSESTSSSGAVSNSRVEQAMADGGFITVIDGDSLSKIAEMFLQQGATRYQAQVAFFDANPQAFVDNNINLLKSGHRLTVPSAEKIRSYSRDIAKQRYKDLVTTPGVQKAAEVAESQPAMEASTPESQTADTAAAETPESATAETETTEPENPEVAREDAASTDENADGDDQSIAETEEFGLRVLPVESEVIASAESGQTSEINQTSEPQQTQDELLDTFSMQGFSTRIRYMDAYLLELQDENQLLKDKIESLEQTVGLLVNFVPVEGLSPEQQAALKILQEDFAGGNISDNTVEEIFTEDTADESSVDTTAESETAAIPTMEAGDDPEQPDNQSQTTAATPTNIPNTENNQDQAISQSPENGGAVEIKETATGEITMANANSGEVTEPESTATTVDNDNSQPEPGSNRVRIKSGWSTRIQELLNNQYFLPGVALFIVAGLLYRRKRIRDEAEVNERLKMDPQIDTRGEAPVAEDSRPGPSQYIHGGKPGQGVTYLEPDEKDNTFLSDDIFSSEEVERTQETSKAETSETAPEVIDMPQDHKLDSITEADVFLKYDRPDLAIQVLEDEYRNGTGNQGLVALKLIDVHESLSGKTDTDSSLKNFIQKLYADIDKFDNSTWQKISERIDQSENS
jgi:FimV-like protein